MEVPELTCLASPVGDRPVPAPGPPGAAGGQALAHLTLGPVVLPREPGLAPAVFLKALPIPLYHTVPPGGLQPRAPLVTGGLEGGSVPFLLSPLLQPEVPSPAQVGKPAAPALTVNILSALPVLSPGPGPTLGSPGKGRNVGKYLCPHCGRDCLKPSVLEKHIRSHTGERPFPCATCGIAFKTQSNLYKHRRTQTHLNNTRLSSESDGPGGRLPDEGNKAGQPSGGAGKGDTWSQAGGDGVRSEKPQGAGHCPGPPAPLCPAAKNLDRTLEAVPGPGCTLADREAPWDSTHMASPGLPPAGSQPRRKLPEQKSPTAIRPSSLQQQQQQTGSWEKPWDSRAAEGRLRKCESTDSGYLSRSDSAEQPPAPCSPLHSLSEHSAESEGEGPPAEPVGREASLELEKRQLEERIARLISHNQAVVDDSQLDTVRPRKTVLSKQGSIDLPVPYTYKDSFHFEIRAPEPGRGRRGVPCAARSTCSPLDKARPLFFHSVPTQLSTTVECVPVTRSNSLPFVEGTRRGRDPPDPQEACPGRQKPLSPRPAPARLVEVPSGHPRALVRQAAVEDLPGPPVGDAGVPAENPGGKRAAAGAGAAGKGHAAGRKCNQKKPKTFSQEKWQVYGNETFKRLYQRMKTSRQGGKKEREMGVGRPLPEEAAGGQEAAPARDDAAVGARPAPRASPPAMETEPPKQKEPVAGAGGSEQPRVDRAASPPAVSPCAGSHSPLLPPDGRLELGCQLPSAPGPLERGDLEADRPVLSDPPLNGSTCSEGGVKVACTWAQTILRQPGGSSGETQPLDDKLPSEKKKLRVEELSCQEPPGPLGAGGDPRGPELDASLPSWSQDRDPGDQPGDLHPSADCAARARAGPLEASGSSSAASSVALRLAGPRDKEPTLGPAAEAPACHSQPAAQPRAPSILAGGTDTLFAPKYLLKLPQGESHAPLPGTQAPGASQDPGGRGGRPEDPASGAGPGLGGTRLPPGLASGPAPAGADSFGEDPSRSQQWGKRKGVLGEDKGDPDTSTPTAGEAPDSTPGAPKETASFLHTPPCVSQKAEICDAGDLGMGSAWARARPSSSVLCPWAPSRGVGRPPEKASQDPPAGPPLGLSACCSLRPGSFLSAAAPPGWPELALCTHSETPGSCRAQSAFPSLRAEPQLTWCCLNRSVPLPTEQKDKAASLYLTLHAAGGSNTRLESKTVSGGGTRTSPRGGGQAPTSKFSYPTASGMPSQDWSSEPEWKRRPPRRRTNMSCGSSKPKKLSISSRRYGGNFSQRRVQARASRLRKPLWVLKKDCRPPSPTGPGPRGTPGRVSSETAGLKLLGEPSCAPTESPLGCGNGEKKEDSTQTPRSVSPGTSSRAVRGTDTPSAKDLSPSAGERGACCPQHPAVGPGLSSPPGSGVAAADNGLPSRGDGVDTGLLGSQRPPSQEQVYADPKPCTFSDAPEPSSREPGGASPGCDAATCAAAIGTSPELRAAAPVRGPPSAKPQGHGRASGTALPLSGPDRQAIAAGTALPLLPREPSPGQGASGSVPPQSPEKTHPEMPASGTTCSHPEEGRPKTCVPSRCGERLGPCPRLGNDSQTHQGSGLIALKDPGVPSTQGQPTDTPEAPLKTVRKRSLEGMRKQTRVEFSDTSSDDEDRLVIEL